MPSQTVTVLNIELPGFATLSGKLEAKELQSLLHALEELASVTVRLHQGMLVSFFGDSFTAVFPAQKPGASTSRQALEACQEFRERMESLLETKKLSKEIGFKAGIALAEAIITGLDEQDNGKVKVMGQAVTFATRLKDFAEKEQALADGNVFEQAKDRFDFLQLESLPLRGSKEALEVYELKGKKRAKWKLDAVSERKIASEMVGRGPEMEQLENLFKQLSAGKGWIVNIVGKAGLGKSRLMAEMKAQPMMDKVLLLEGRAMSTGQNLSFHPITNLIKSWAEITEEDLPSVASEKLFQGIKRNSAEQADEIYAFLATMMGLPLTGKHKERVKGIEGEALEKLILKNLRDLIIAATKDKPRIYMIEDMHWADSSSITMFESLYKLSQNYPVMFINVMRPGYKETGDYILKYLEDKFPGDHTTININPLEEKESGNLIKNLLRNTHLPGEIQSMIIRKTEGNPFFIEEIIRSFIDEGVVEVRDNGLWVTEKINVVNIPDTINEVILSRVDKLDEKTKELLKTASVIGRNFYYKVLEEAADTIGAFGERLEYLKEIQLISESREKDEIEYLFKHALAQQATYESIVLNTKKELHLKIARSIEKVFSENLNEFYGTLAYHYEKAEQWEKAEECLVKAGLEAMLSGASHEATNHLRKGLEIYRNLHPNDPEREKLADYYYNLSLTCHRGGLNMEAIDNIDKFLNLYFRPMPSNKPLLAFSLVWRLVNFLLAINFPKYYFKKVPTGFDDKSLKLIGIKGNSMVTLNPGSLFLEGIYFSKRLVSLDLSGIANGIGLLMEYSGIFIWTGISFPVGRKITNVTERFIDKENQSAWMKYRYVAIEYRLFTGDFTPDADEDEVIHIGVKSGAFWETATYLIFNTYIHLERGDWKKSSQTRQRLLETAEVFENEHSRVQYYRMTGIAHSKFRRIEDMLENSAKALDDISKTGHVTMLMMVQCSRVLALALKGEFAEADRYIEEVRRQPYRSIPAER